MALDWTCEQSEGAKDMEQLSRSWLGPWRVCPGEIMSIGDLILPPPRRVSVSLAVRGCKQCLRTELCRAGVYCSWISPTMFAGLCFVRLPVDNCSIETLHHPSKMLSVPQL